MARRAGTVVEFRSGPFARVAGAAFFAVVVLILGDAAVATLAPGRAWFTTVENDLGFGSLLQIAAMFVVSLLVWLQIERYRLEVDERGITEQTAFETVRVPWEEVASYRLNRERGYAAKWIVVPELLGPDDRVRFRPTPPLVVRVSRNDFDHAAFWRHVEARLADRNVPRLS